MVYIMALKEYLRISKTSEIQSGQPSEDMLFGFTTLDISFI